MNEQECLSKMVAPGTPRPGKYRQGVIQIHLTRACDKSCYGCTQGSQLRGKLTFMPVDAFEDAVVSLRGYFGVVGVFGGNPALHPKFSQICEVLRKHVPFNQRGIWCNHPLGKGAEMRRTFDPSVSNLNVHLDREAYSQFKRDWPECGPVGLTTDSRHSPCYVAMRDVLKRDCVCVLRDFPGNYEAPYPPCPFGKCDGSGQVYDEGLAWELISKCDINQHWSAMIGMFRGELRAWFCEVAGAQAILHQDEVDYPDTGVDVTDPAYQTTDALGPWWRRPMRDFAHQVRKHCHDCSVPLKGHGSLAQAGDRGVEQVSKTHAAVFKPKQLGRKVELVTVRAQLGDPLDRMTKYLQNVDK